MIPQAQIIAWRANSPWNSAVQVEQDLIICRALVELFSRPVVANNLAFRGGTALHKIHLAPAARYSEDIDLVQAREGSLDPILAAVREALGFLGEPEGLFGSGIRNAVRQTGLRLGRGVETLMYRFTPEGSGGRPRRLKVEVNGREKFSVLGLKQTPFRVESAWYNGHCDITTFPVEELLGTKMRALYQRSKGRDLFDLWCGLTVGKANPAAVVNTFRKYTGSENLTISQGDFRQNLAAKVANPDFLADIEGLLRPGFEYDYHDAHNIIEGQLLSLL